MCRTPIAGTVSLIAFVGFLAGQSPTPRTHRPRGFPGNGRLRLNKEVLKRDTRTCGRAVPGLKELRELKLEPSGC